MTAPDVACPVRGHDHALTVLREHVQDGTGTRAWMLGCPGGRYRFFKIDGSVGVMPRFVRPRFGWPTS